jgi:hypothetical protein
MIGENLKTAVRETNRIYRNKHKGNKNGLEPVVKVPASPARANEERMNEKNECETAGPCKCSGRALLKIGADAVG